MHQVVVAQEAAARQGTHSTKTRGEVRGGGNAVTQKSLRNIERVRVLASGQLNPYDVLASDHVVFTQAALAEFVARTGGGELVTVDKPAKTEKAAKPKAAAEAAGDGDEPA